MLVITGLLIRIYSTIYFRIYLTMHVWIFIQSDPWRSPKWPVCWKMAENEPCLCIRLSCIMWLLFVAWHFVRWQETAIWFMYLISLSVNHDSQSVQISFIHICYSIMELILLSSSLGWKFYILEGINSHLSQMNWEPYAGWELSISVITR